MDSRLKQKLSKEKETLLTVNGNSVDFERWASAVREQMLACLQKRTRRSRSELSRDHF